MSGILVLGTSSGVGKTTFCAMLCRELSKRNMDPVPFKGLNLSLNSYATQDGGEIGIGQAFQAWSAGLEPETDMNPVLLKPAGNGVIQLILNGRPSMDIPSSTSMDRDTAMKATGDAYRRLESAHRFVVCEGSGSPVELNIMDRDIANVGLMRELGIPAILVGDIERGGVFAALYGTWKLIPDDVRPLVRGFVINRFRGDPSILENGISEVKRLTKMRCLGVLPHMDLRFPEEDSLSDLSGRLKGSDVRSAFISNVDALTDAAKESGLDFDSIIEMGGDLSSARGYLHRANLHVL